MARTIKERVAGRSVAFLTNPGNLGDALIEAGASAFLTANEIPHRWHNSRRLRELHAKYYKLAYAKNRSLRALSGGIYEKYTSSLREIAKEHEVAIICGSGGFSKQAHVAMQILELCADLFSDIIVLPSTYAMPPRTGDHILLFARDRFESLGTVPSATFCHDMAFFLDPGPIEPIRQVGYHVRTDVERSGWLPSLRESFDVSAIGTELDPISLMFNEVGKSEIIVTDRLHVCTAAALLGRRVYLFRGSYFKNEAIYKSSLQPYYPNVTLLDDWGQLPEGVRP
jgi:exopolysaccharide biosynthesis predicted pyruvyltransferase EpsI